MNVRVRLWGKLSAEELMLLNCGVGELLRRSNQSILKEINPEYSLEGLMLTLKLQYFGHLMQRTDSLEKNPDAGKDWRQEEKGTTEDEMVGWHHQFYGHEFEQTLGVGDGQGSLECYRPQGCKVRHVWAAKLTELIKALASNFQKSKTKLLVLHFCLLYLMWKCPLWSPERKSTGRRNPGNIFSPVMLTHYNVPIPSVNSLDDCIF